MDKPKRKRSKDNPYYLDIIDGKYYVRFKDEKNTLNIVEVTEKQYYHQLLNRNPKQFHHMLD